MIRYAIKQEDGQTVRTDYTDTKLFKKEATRNDVLGGDNSNL